MLIELKIKNCFSIQDEQTLSFVASDDTMIRHNTFQAANLTLLKSVAVYGANAAGKTNLVRIISIMKHLILESTERKIGDNLQITPFLLGNDKNNPSELEIAFVIDDVKYRYGFSLNRNRFLEEWLFAYPDNEPQQWFLRCYDANQDKDEFDWSEHFQDETNAQQKTRENVLFLSAAIKWNNKQLRPIFKWFHNLNISSIMGFYNAKNLSVEMLKDNKINFLKYIKDVDLDIEDIKIEEKEINMQELPYELRNMLLDNPEKISKIDIKTLHFDQDGNIVEFYIQQESDGTKKFFEFLGPIMDTLENGKILVIDELHNHLHPMMTKFIIGLFHSKSFNKNNAQLLFTTHETSVLSDEIFRKDQVYFCEKQNKATRFYSMSDFNGIKEDWDFEQSYLLGRFGALPNILQP